MKIKDLPKGIELRGVKVRPPNGESMFWYSQWNKGVWLKRSMDSNRLYPYTEIKSLEECFEWEVVDDRFLTPPKQN